MEISVVDQSPIFTNTNADQAIKDSVELAQYSDQIGLKRFWLAEHHGSSSFAGCSPEILIPRIASSTKNIRSLPSDFPNSKHFNRLDKFAKVSCVFCSLIKFL